MRIIGQGAYLYLNGDFVSMSQRPQLLLIVVIVVIAVGIYQILQGLGYMDIGPLHPGIENTSGMSADLWDLVMTVAGGMMIIIGLLSLLIGFMVYNGSRIARIILIVVLILELIFSLFSLNAFGLFMVVLCIVLLYILFRPDVKQYFRA